MSSFLPVYGDLTGFLPNLQLTTTGVTPGNYAYLNGTIDSKGRITSASGATTSEQAGVLYDLAFVTKPSDASLVKYISNPQSSSTIAQLSGTLSSCDITPDSEFLWISDDGNSVFVVSTLTNALVQTITEPQTNLYEPKSTAFSPYGQFAYVANYCAGGPSFVSKFDATTYAFISKCNVDNGAYVIRIADNGLFAYVINSISLTVSVIDLTSFTVSDTISVGPGEFCTAFDLDTANAFLYAGVGDTNTSSNNKIVKIDLSDNSTTSGSYIFGNPFDLCAKISGKLWISNTAQNINVYDSSTLTNTLSIGSAVPSDMYFRPSPDLSAIYVSILDEIQKYDASNESFLSRYTLGLTVGPFAVRTGISVPVYPTFVPSSTGEIDLQIDSAKYRYYPTDGSLTIGQDNVLIGLTDQPATVAEGITGAVAIGPSVVATQSGGFFTVHNSGSGNAAAFTADGQLIEMISSRRFKSNIQDLEEVSEKIDLMRPVRFTLNADETQRPNIGLIAEEVEAIFPEFVTYQTDGQVSGLMCDRMIALAIKEIQSLQSELLSWNS